MVQKVNQISLLDVVSVLRKKGSALRKRIVLTRRIALKREIVLTRKSVLKGEPEVAAVLQIEHPRKISLRRLFQVTVQSV